MSQHCFFKNLIRLSLCFAAFILLQSQAHAQVAGFDDPGARNGGGTGGLIPVEPSVDGGTIPTGSAAQVVVLFRNDGGQPVQTGLIRLFPSSNVTAEVALDLCKDYVEGIPPGVECPIAISVKGLQAGQFRVEMLMSHTGRSRLVTATLSGNVEAGGDSADRLSSDIETIPNELDFESINQGQSSVEPVILRNVTSSPINIQDIFIDSAPQSGYRLRTDCETLAAGEACLAIVTWSPQLSGRSTGVLVVKHDGPARVTSVTMTGEYEPDEVEEATPFPDAVPGKGLLVSSQEEIDFGDDIDTASTITVSLVNTGDVPLDIEDIIISGSDNGLSFREGGCAPGLTLDPIEACPLAVNWSPTRVGAILDDIQVIHTGARGILVLPVRGDASGTVSKDQKAVVLNTRGESSTTAGPESERGKSRRAPAVKNPETSLDGFKITSFSPDRAIINGPGGSRLIFDSEEVIIGGLPWYVDIQRNGIEFIYDQNRILLLFDRSLSSINRVTASSENVISTSSTSESVEEN